MSSSSYTASAPTSSTTSTDSSVVTDHRPLIAAVVIGVIALFVIAGILWFTLRSKRPRAANLEEGPRKGNDTESSMWWGVGVDKDHPAARITPFGRARVGTGMAEGPRFSEYQISKL